MGEEADSLYGLVEQGIEECENYFRDRRSTASKPHGRMKHPNKSEATMSKSEALKRALEAVSKAYADSHNFEGGSMASDEILGLIRQALRDKFH